MIRGTTPTLNFTLPFNCSEITKCNIAFSQLDIVVLEKSLSDCTQAGKVLTCCLSEDETLILDAHKPLEIQLRIGCGNSRLASNIIKTDVKRILKDGCL